MQKTKSQNSRFSLLIQEIQGSETREYTACILAFINCTLAGPGDVNKRLKLRNELVGKFTVRLWSSMRLSLIVSSGGIQRSKIKVCMHVKVQVMLQKCGVHMFSLLLPVPLMSYSPVYILMFPVIMVPVCGLHWKSYSSRLLSGIEQGGLYLVLANVRPLLFWSVIGLTCPPMHNKIICYNFWICCCYYLVHTHNYIPIDNI